MSSRFKVHGAYEHNGENVEKIYAASSADGARALANQDGILVSHVEPYVAQAAAVRQPTRPISVMDNKRGDDELPPASPPRFLEGHKTKNETVGAVDDIACLLVGWICMVLIPIVGALIAWYLFQSAVARRFNPATKVSLSIARVLCILWAALIVITLASILYRLLT